MKIALVAHPDRAEAAAVAESVRAACVELGVGIVEVPEAEVVVSVGGDGTLLRAVRAAGSQIPVVGIDVGYVGYLAEVEPEDAAGLVARLAAGDYDVVEQMTVTVELPDGTEVSGLNDVVIEKVVSQHALRLRCLIDGEHLLTYRADGLIVSTPTGSTAYAYSAGGPVVDPAVDGLVLVAVAPHNLFSRPIVLGPERVVQLDVLADRPARVNVDGQDHGVVDSGQQLVVRRGDDPALLVRLDGAGFAARLSVNLGIPTE